MNPESISGIRKKENTESPEHLESRLQLLIFKIPLRIVSGIDRVPEILSPVLSWITLHGGNELACIRRRAGSVVSASDLGPEGVGFEPFDGLVSHSEGVETGDKRRH